ncbi:U1 small nuclear ribonucleoprotein 70 kDa-like isoform X2 [Trichoplusia ni]|nr:U1 small nuclear ribonucleoprotein 70 kDa-like isoform X2 [Trichoplusia ni]XP_026742587.1 U1 small nuclear ribonucleoprotein 70 kDa-like isoform X2 [Trichoplusia ni]
MSLARLQASYSADERRAIHQAVVSAVPSCHDLADLALPGDGDKAKGRVILTRFEILAELRNMRRRRTKYRVAAKTRNYSDVLRDVIKTQMEHYNVVKTEPVDEISNSGPTTSNPQLDRNGENRDSYRSRERDMPRPIIETSVKTEREHSRERDRDYSRERFNRERRYEDRRREGRNAERNRHQYYEKSDERRHDKTRERSRRYQEKSKRFDQGDEREDRYREKRQDKYKDRRYNDSNRDRSRGRRSSSHQHSDYENRVKIEPGIEEGSDRRRDRRRRSREKRYSSDSYREHDHEERVRRHETHGGDYETRVKREPDFNETGDDWQSEYHERSTERIPIKQERERSIPEDDRSYEQPNIREKNRYSAQHSYGKHKEKSHSSDQYRERSNAYSATSQRSKYKHKSNEKKRNSSDEYRHDKETDRRNRHREKSHEMSYIKQEEESPEKEGHREKGTKKHEKYRDSGTTDRYKEKSKQRPIISDDYRKYDRSKDNYRSQRYNRDRSYDRGSYYSRSSEETDAPTSYKRYYDNPAEPHYDPHKKIKVEK